MSKSVKFASMVAAGCLAAATLGALAGKADEMSALVRYGDLDLKSDGGVATLNQRIATAADRICGPVDHRDLAAYDRYRECRVGAIARATPRTQELVAAARGGDSQYASMPAQQKPLH
jgi:UrcA family protein